MTSWMSNLVGWPHPGEARLMAFKDGELPSDAASRVSRHLVRCPYCRCLLDRQCEAAELIRETVPCFSDDDFGRELANCRSVLAQAAQEPAAQGSAQEPPQCSPACSREQLARIFGASVLERLSCLDPQASLKTAVTSERLVSAFLGMKVDRVALLR